MPKVRDFARQSQILLYMSTREDTLSLELGRDARLAGSRRAVVAIDSTVPDSGVSGQAAAKISAD